MCGIGVEKDGKKAIDLFQAAAVQGHPVAQYSLGIYYFEQARDYYSKGDLKGVENLKVAFNWFKQAERNEKNTIIQEEAIDSLFALYKIFGKYYYSNHRNMRLICLHAAAHAGHKKAKEQLQSFIKIEAMQSAFYVSAKAYEDGSLELEIDHDALIDLYRLIGKNAPPGQLKIDAQAAVDRLLNQQAKKADEKAGAEKTEIPTPSDAKKSELVQLKQDAKEQRNSGGLSEKDEGAKKDKNEAKAIADYQKKAAQGDAEAQYQLALCHAQGRGGLEKNKEKIFELCELAAKQGHKKAQYNLGLQYDQDNKQEQAQKWFKDAAVQGHKAAQKKLDGFSVAKSAAMSGGSPVYSGSHIARRPKGGAQKSVSGKPDMSYSSVARTPS